jgi:endonuclease YncB( thermonuclease family)
MAHKILIFKILFLIFFFNNNILFAKNIIGIPKIIDGDTIYIDKDKIRLHGIDAPEKDQDCTFQEKKWACGKQSTIELKKMINNQIIKCVSKSIDIYKRYLAVCSVNRVNLNQNMVKQGWAVAYRYYSLDYITEEKYAQDNLLGIWKGKFENPYIFRQKNNNK